jgi:hypothetical protein
VLLESSYVQIVLFGMVHFGKTGLHLATIVFNDDFPSLTTVNACSCKFQQEDCYGAGWQYLVDF